MITWLVAFLDVLLQVIALYGVGYALLRIFGMRHLFALVCAPIASIINLLILTTLYGFSNGVITANYLTLVFLPLLVFVALFALLNRRSPASAAKRLLMSSYMRIYAGYVAFAALILVVMFVLMIGAANNYAWLVDNAHHMGTAFTLTQNPNWSLLSPWANSYYLPGQDPLSQSGDTLSFYPPVWQWLAALPATLISQNIAIATTATIVTACVVVVPTSFFALLYRIFRDNKEMLAAGIVTSVAFISFPWILLVWGPLYPNLISYALVPLGVLSCLQLFKSASLARFAKALLLFICSFVAIALAQPNGVFVLGIIMAPFLVWQCSRLPLVFAWTKKHALIKWALRLLCGLIGIGAIFFIWRYLATSSFMADVVHFYWDALQNRRIALINTLFLQLLAPMSGGPQFVLASCVLVGFVACLIKKPTRWMAVSYLCLAMLYCICLASRNPDKWQLTGFWYNDSYRLSSALAIIGVPIATCGLAILAGGVAGALRRLFHAPRVTATALFTAGLACFAIQTFMVSPSVNLDEHQGENPILSQGPSDTDVLLLRPFAREQYLVARNYNPAFMHKVAKKRAFMQQASQIVGTSWVLNSPWDGSVFGYPCEGLNTLVRSPSIDTKQTPALYTMVSNLDQLAQNLDLQKQMKDMGVNYVLRLERTDDTSSGFLTDLDHDAWAGFYRLSATTPGFELVQAQDGMQLYRVAWEQLEQQA